MGKAIGIDLGTTNSVMAILKGEQPRTIENVNGSRLTPSVVSVGEDGELLVGEEAKAQAIIYPKNTIFSIKRFMGRLYGDEEVQNDIKMVPYEVTEAENGEAAVWLKGKAYSPIEISTFILEALKQEAEEQMGEITHAVITVPANFGQRQRDATRRAGQLAGLQVMRVLPEPTAAAMAYGIDVQSGEDKTILVYDLGGGTFDVTVMLVAGGVFVELANTGDNHLGGDNFDQEIIKYIIEHVRRRHKVDLQNNREALQKLKEAAETAKVTLSGRRSQARITIPAIAQDRQGGWINIQLNLTQQEYEDMIRPYVKRTIELVHQAIREADCLIEDIDHILLAGGSTLTPLVVESLRAEFGEDKILRNINPMECVAAGAAIQASLPPPEGESYEGLEKECPKCHRLNSLERADCRYCGFRWQEIEAIGGLTPKPLGIQTEGDKMEVIVPKGTRYPTTEPITRYFHTNRPDQDFVRIPVYEGSGEMATQNEYLGEAQGKLPAGLPNNTEVAVSFSLDTDGIIFVTAQLPDKPEVEIKAEIDMGKTRKAPPPSMPGPGQPAAPPPPRGWKEEAQAMLDIAGFTLGRGSRYLDQRTVYQIQAIMNELRGAIESDYEALARQKKVELEEAVNKLGFVTLLVFAEALAAAPDVDVSPHERIQLTNLVAEAQQALKNRDEWQLRSALSELSQLVQEITKRIQATGAPMPDVTDLLKS